MRVQIITKDNGLGLSHDYRVLREAILMARPGTIVELIDWEQPHRGEPGTDINVFLELINWRFCAQAKRNVFVPNPEWYFSHLWGAHIGRMTEVWAKTDDCVRRFEGIHKRVIKSGWTSEDKLDGTARRHRRKAMLHVAGGSDAKGTDAVLAAMYGLPAHRLTLVTKKDRGRLPPNVDVMKSPSDDELRALMNTHLVHLCPSSYEGFGHYINEARSCGAFVVTTNAAPMNELIDGAIGAGVAPYSYARQNLAQHSHVSAADLGQAISAVMAAPSNVLEHIGARARSRYLTDRAAFHDFIKTTLQA